MVFEISGLRYALMLFNIKLIKIYFKYIRSVDIVLSLKSSVTLNIIKFSITDFSCYNLSVTALTNATTLNYY